MSALLAHTKATASPLERELLQRVQRGLDSHWKVTEKTAVGCTFGDVYSLYGWHCNGILATTRAWDQGGPDTVALLQPFQLPRLKAISMLRCLIDKASEGIFTSERAGTTPGRNRSSRRVHSSYDSLCITASVTYTFIELIGWAAGFLISPEDFHVKGTL
ncbi:uncharacterized protein K460DRAFT_355009 [Cucurbitaria berberidis CBS 394.84]|uniref:Uncharacterized protein n=1 Tax=Cucurbitaria berberidis CBS 394.84 TaxID=1168544 RepID=A0A9P4GGJ5_9PLEO|nr:uncharacterized protein K460DRAFT_355009 [Cucurbitaria berberidis CBS 394.84]KAF1845160.1 hypothetical protein K460DRAFT_355009 [Cucurbitaria berberidis CBS 394.84]